MKTLAFQLDEIAKRVIEAVHPLRIVLFGSAARGDFHQDSDIDLLVVMPNGTHRRRTAQALYQVFGGLQVAVDIVVATPDDLNIYGDTIGLVYRNALTEGRELYAA